jgi:hypothetical protein
LPGIEARLKPISPAGYKTAKTALHVRTAPPNTPTTTSVAIQKTPRSSDKNRTTRLLWDFFFGTS